MFPSTAAHFLISHRRVLTLKGWQQNAAYTEQRSQSTFNYTTVNMWVNASVCGKCGTRGADFTTVTNLCIMCYKES